MAGTFPALPVFVGETVMEVCIYLKRGWKDCMISFLRNICSYKPVSYTHLQFRWKWVKQLSMYISLSLIRY